MNVQQMLAAIGEPARFQILTVLAAGPLTVGEVAAAVGARQPQTTKHLQLLESVGVLRVRRLGRRKLASLDRDALAELARWLEGLAVRTDDDRVLDDYADAIAELRSAGADALKVDFTIERRIDAPVESVWDAWTDPALAALWWAPRHFEVIRCAIEAVPGGRTELVLREGDGAEYASAGSVRVVEEYRRLVFDLSPVDAQGQPLLNVVLDVRLDGGADTAMRVTVQAGGIDADAAAMLAGLKPGWTQQLDRLDMMLTQGRA